MGPVYPVDKPYESPLNSKKKSWCMCSYLPPVVNLTLDSEFTSIKGFSLGTFSKKQEAPVRCLGASWNHSPTQDQLFLDTKFLCPFCNNSILCSLSIADAYSQMVNLDVCELSSRILGSLSSGHVDI